MNELSPLVRLGLLLIRPGMLVMLTPFAGGPSAPARAKLGLMVALALLLAPVVPAPAVLSSGNLAFVVARELAIGLSLALVVTALVAGAEFGGHLVGHQIGFTYGATVDPASGVRNTVLASLYGMLATLALFTADAHHRFFRALGDSYRTLPMGEGGVSPALVDGVRSTLALVLTTGLRLAAPILLVLLLVEVAMALLARSAPALNQMIVGHGVRILVGLVVLAALVGAVPRIMPALAEVAAGIGRGLATAFR